MYYFFIKVSTLVSVGSNMFQNLIKIVYIFMAPSNLIVKQELFYLRSLICSFVNYSIKIIIAFINRRLIITTYIVSHSNKIRSSAGHISCKQGYHILGLSRSKLTVFVLSQNNFLERNDETRISPLFTVAARLGFF